MTEKKPNIPTVQPFFVEPASAQTNENRNVIGVPSQQQPTQGSDGFTQLLGAGVGGAVAATALFKMFERFGSNLIDGQKSKIALELRAKELELEAEKAERAAARKEEESKGELIKSTLNTALSNVYQGSRESREIYYALIKEIQEGNILHQKGFADILDRLDVQDKRIEIMEYTMRDILNVLNMRERQGVK